MKIMIESAALWTYVSWRLLLVYETLLLIQIFCITIVPVILE
jgi:hypothetical protein